MEFIYKGLNGTFERVIVTDEEIDRQLLRLRQQMPCVKAVDRPAKLGDEVMMDYTTAVSACVLRPAGDEKFLYLVLPVQV